MFIRSDAFVLKRQLEGHEYNDYAGYGSNWEGMLAVLHAKFAAEPLKTALARTGDAFLLEHNSRVGLDAVWSDKGDRSGSNWLGFQLVLVRDEITGSRAWTDALLAVAPDGSIWRSAVKRVSGARAAQTSPPRAGP